jgi:signal transduction histidine kinase
MPDDTAFAQLVSLACHDVRTPLATVYGFARTMERSVVATSERRYLEMIAASSLEITDIVDRLSVAARIEDGRWQPELVDVDSGELARAAAARLDGGRVVVTAAETASVRVDPGEAERSLAALARCALRHGELERVDLSVAGSTFELAPVTAVTARIALGEELKDFGAAVAVSAIRALGGSAAASGETLTITLPEA